MTWRPIATAPTSGKILVASYAPTNWAYFVSTVHLHPEMSPRHRENQLRYARAWQPMPDEPARDIND